MPYISLKTLVVACNENLFYVVKDLIASAAIYEALNFTNELDRCYTIWVPVHEPHDSTHALYFSSQLDFSSWLPNCHETTWRKKI